MNRYTQLVAAVAAICCNYHCCTINNSAYSPHKIVSRFAWACPHKPTCDSHDYWWQRMHHWDYGSSWMHDWLTLRCSIVVNIPVRRGIGHTADGQRDSRAYCRRRLWLRGTQNKDHCHPCSLSVHVRSWYSHARLSMNSGIEKKQTNKWQQFGMEL